MKCWICYEAECEGTYTRAELKELFEGRIFDEQRRQGSDFDSWLYEMEHMQILIPLRKSPE